MKELYCLNCKHFFIFMGYNAEICCLEDHWELDRLNDEIEFRNHMGKATDCPDYVRYDQEDK